MSSIIDFHIKEFNLLEKYPKDVFYKGDLSLLNKRKVSIVGSRRPNAYCVKYTNLIANELSKRDIVVVSGAAMGVDAIAHKASSANNTIAVVANGLNIRYPAINSKLIEDIEKKGLVLSTYSDDEMPRNYTFVQRNELVVALGEVLIVTQADINSGSLRSIEFALKMNKKVYTLPHRLDESLGTQKLVEEGLIEPIYDLNKFFDTFGEIKVTTSELAAFINSFPSYEEAVKKYKSKIFELELEGIIKIENGFVRPL
ncbi:DNA processing protein DprA [Halarcobacter ebronensis]|uniref:DNA processing protein DprA n=1 Tax=Halarcobacter ebronensis TaxID=1462615 RepID=A0A4Q0YC66_9BACT|nr:DNA-processing protein DprA [Halarcobacter ebronensis]RXJ67154.1 DNA processing protein DprA [Halarcobacter ebronensis]